MEAVLTPRKSLYNIQEEHLNLLALIEENEGLLTEEIEQALQLNEIELQEKAVSYGYLIKHLTTEIAEAKEMAKQAKEYADKKEKALEAFKTRLSEAMQQYGLLKVELPTLKLSFRKSESVDCDASVLGSEWTRVRTIVEPDKDKIKAALKEGVKIEGATLIQKNNLQIK